MSKIKPFRAVVYNQEKIGDYSRVVCPPYDIISAQAQEHYHQASPYNLIHILLGKDVPGEDKYERAGAYFGDWLKKEILIRDKSPAIYFYNQEYTLEGERRRRLGFISLLKLEDNNASVFTHENTRSEAIEDRARLIREVKANLSPIFVVFSDKKRIIKYVYQHYIRSAPPFIDITDDEKTVHKVWRIDSAQLLDKMQAAMSEEDIFIADGHHRYEVACAWRQELKNKYGSISGEEDFNYVLSYFTNVDPKGLAILPIHRLVKLSVAPDLADLTLKIKGYFDIEEVKDRIRFFFLLRKAGCQEHVLGMHNSLRYWLLRLKNKKALEGGPCDKSRQYQSLDVSILNYLVLQRVMGLDLEDKQVIAFNPNADEIIEKVDSDPSCIAFFLNPARIQDIMSVALAGQKLPPKSTYFYPKVLSGLVINKFEDS